MKTINLTKGQVSLVDDEDYDFLMQWKWHAIKGKHTFYAVRNASRLTENNSKRTILMHREIMQTPEDMIVDHIDHNGLNCQKSNMRNCTYQQNSTNKKSSGVSRYLGVSYLKNKYITAGIWINGRCNHLGNFKTEEAAARAYDEAAKNHYGEFANLNFPKDGI